MSKFANVTIVDSPTVSNTQWRAQQALEQVYPVRKSFSAHPAQIPLNPGTPIHKFDDAVGVTLPQTTVAVPAKPTPIHRTQHGLEWGCAIALALGISLALIDFLIKLRLNKMRKGRVGIFHNCSCQSGQGNALPVVDSTEPYPWEVK